MSLADVSRQDIYLPLCPDSLPGQAHPMNCSVYRSPRKDYTYIYLAEGHTLEDIPSELLDAFGAPEFVIDLDLSPERELATENVKQVMRNLSERGYHLQLPPGDMQGDPV
jgi:uncharacterized protein YcgL (UPF0745 family)